MADATNIAAPNSRSSAAMMTRLSTMMFLQYWPLGAWGVTYGTYIAANTGAQGDRIFSAGFVGYSTAAGAIGSLLSPLIIGFISDRYIAAQNLLGAMHIACAVAAWSMFATHSQMAFFVCLLAYYQCFSPAATLTNKISLKHLANVAVEYPIVRFFSTVGWIAAGLFVGLAWPFLRDTSIEATAVPLMIGAVANLAMAAYSFTLPSTPPEEHAGLFWGRMLRDAAELLRNRTFVLFLVISMIACIPSMAYNNFGNAFLNNLHYNRPAALMTLGQVSDLVFLMITPWLLSRFDLRSMFLAGIFAWALRYVSLAAGSGLEITWPVYAAILMNGPCFVFIFIVGVMYVDRLVGGTHRGAAQGMFAIATAGVANLSGALLVGFTQARFLTPDGVSPPPFRWTPFWFVPALVCSGTLLLCVVVMCYVRSTTKHEPRIDLN
jgi:nucleoside transporter